MGIFGGENKQSESGAFDTIIGAKARFKGEISSDGSISVNGEFEGKLKTSGEIVVGKGSRVVGDVEGANVLICGRVEGNVNALQTLEIEKSGRVNGDLTGGRIVIEDGASYRGRVRVRSAEEKEARDEVAEILERSVDEPADKEFTPAHLS